MGFPCDSVGKESTCNVGDLGLIPWLERSPGEGKGYALQYSGLENSMNHGLAKSQAWLSDFHFTSRMANNSSSLIQTKFPLNSWYFSFPNLEGFIYLYIYFAYQNLKSQLVCYWMRCLPSSSARFPLHKMCCAWSLSHVQLFAAPRAAVCRLLCPWGFSRQGYWGGFAYKQSPIKSNKALWGGEKSRADATRGYRRTREKQQ